MIYDELANSEMEKAGLSKSQRDFYNEIVSSFLSFDHGNETAQTRIHMIAALINRQAITPLTDNADDWVNISDTTNGQGNLWRSKRDSRAFSHDGGTTYFYTGKESEIHLSAHEGNR